MSGIEFLPNPFLKKDFHENYNKLQAQIKKTFESALEANQAHNIGDLSCYSSDYEDEEIFTSKNTLKLWINNEEIEVPADLVKVTDVKDIFNKEVFETALTQEEQEHLLSYLPRSADQGKILDDLFSGKPFLHNNPLETFFEKLRSGCYTKTFQKEREIENRLAGVYSRNYYENMSNLLKMKLEDSLQEHEKKHEISNLLKRNATIDLESLSRDSELSVESINDIRVENSIDEISESETILEETISEVIKMPTGDTDDDLAQNRKFEAQRTLAREIAPSKKPDTDSIMLSMSAPKSTSKVTKNILTIKLSSKEWVERYREQERERYNNPTRPWFYHLPDGSTAITAPVAKKISTAVRDYGDTVIITFGSKIRNLADRPSYITILCLVRDAAARLPSGEGTRADICELLKESQYINETISDDRLSTVVSGALDRLHYEDDPCVKYDAEKKLWIYLHRTRTEDYGPWIDQSDSRSSKKKEYNMKYKVKKKLKTEENSARSETDKAPSTSGL